MTKEPGFERHILYNSSSYRRKSIRKPPVKIKKFKVSAHAEMEFDNNSKMMKELVMEQGGKIQYYLYIADALMTLNQELEKTDDPAIAIIYENEIESCLDEMDDIWRGLTLEEKEELTKMIDEREM